MTFDEVRAQATADEPLYFRHPDLDGTCCFDRDGELGFIGSKGEHGRPPLWLSDFDRDDWEIDTKCY